MIQAGTQLTADNLNEAFGVIKFKTANESVTSSTTFQNDDHLFFPVLAAATYVLDGYVLFDAAEASDIKCDFDVPNDASFLWTNFATVGAGTPYTGYNVVAQGDTVSRTIDGNAATVMSFAPRGYIVTVSAGTMQFRWAQATSGGTATRVLAGSWMRLARVA